MTVQTQTGDLPKIIRNTDNLYEGDLVHYFQVLFFKATNLHHPYHNFRHMLHVTWLCYDACLYYGHERISRREMRCLLIAALFHDFDHSGGLLTDDLNIEAALEALNEHLLPEDRAYGNTISAHIRTTEYPHKGEADHFMLCSAILRDADVAQALSPAWIQQVVFGLAKESSVPPFNMLKGQEVFHTNTRFITDWAKEQFPPELITAKIAEARDLIEILEGWSE